MYALIDCNNFYASCERLFRPDLATTPIVVLSNNDGAVVARSAEAKKMGIGMGEPWFKLKEKGLDRNVMAFSSNYALYGDLSNRVMTMVESEFRDCEVYSIDEVFASVPGFGDQLHGVCVDLRERIQKHIGIGTGIGCGATKTLAKLANYAAKKYPATGGVVVLDDPERIRRLRSITPVNEVWGVGRRLSARLVDEGIRTADQLATACPERIRKRYSVVLERTVMELNGVSCLPLEMARPVRKQIIRSRSFGSEVYSLNELKVAIANHAVSAAETLQNENLTAKVIQVYISTNPFKDGFYRNTATAELVVPSNARSEVVQVAMDLVDTIFRSGRGYKKAGVLAIDLVSCKHVQLDLYNENGASPTLDRTISQINNSFPGGIILARTLGGNNWKMSRKLISPAYTTKWNSLPIAR